MDKLPLEVLEFIFKYLISLEDRKAASLVCHQWYKAYLQNYFRNGEVINITKDKHLWMLPNLENDRQYYHFVMRNVEITENSCQFWERFGRHMKTLVFTNCNIRERMFVKALSNCTKLESLTVNDCKELLMAGLLLENVEDQISLRNALTNLKVLDLSSNSYLSDAILMKLLSLCPNVTSIALRDCKISYHFGMFKKFYPNGLSPPSESVTTFQMILQYVLENSQRIKNLSFSETFIDDQSLANLAQTENLKLQGLELGKCVQLSNKGLLHLSHSFKSLTELDLSSCLRITDVSLVIVFSQLDQLTKLSLSSSNITDRGLENISSLKRLKSLNLSECELIKDDGLINGLCKKINYEILDLTLSHLGNISEDALLQLAKCLPNLKHLDLESCFNAVTDRAIQALFNHCTRLRTLNLAQCDRITDCGLTGMGVSLIDAAHTLPKLLRVPLGSKTEQEIWKIAKIKKEVRNFCEKELLSSDKTGFYLSDLKGLQRLNLRGCKHLSDVSLKYAFKLQELKSLDLSGCHQISTEGLTSLARNCPSIEELNMDDCHNVDDASIEIVMGRLTRLKRLTLGSDKITDAISQHILNNAVQLSYIDLRNCGQITKESASLLFKCLPLLHTLHYPERNLNEEDSMIPDPPKYYWFRP